MAEGEGFEPPVSFQVQRFSRPPVSTTHTSLRGGCAVTVRLKLVYNSLRTTKGAFNSSNCLAILLRASHATRRYFSPKAAEWNSITSEKCDIK